MTTPILNGLPASPTTNPSNAPDKQKPGRDRIPMSLPIQRLEAPEIPGFHTHWFRGDAMRINRALKAGYSFVDQAEVDMNTVGIADDLDSSGHTDLGSRVSIVAGKAEDGGAERLYLMKLPLELWESDQVRVGERQEGIAAQLRGDKGFSEAGLDTGHRYAGKQSNENKNIFLPKPQRRA